MYDDELSPYEKMKADRYGINIVEYKHISQPDRFFCDFDNSELVAVPKSRRTQPERDYDKILFCKKCFKEFEIIEDSV